MPLGIHILNDISVKLTDTAVDGRPLIENQDIINGKRVRRPKSTLHGSRFGIPNNVDGLLQVLKHKQAVLDGFAYLNRTHFGPTTPTEVSVYDLWVISNLAVCAPSFLFNRGENPYGRQDRLPVEVATIYKAALGIRRVPMIMRDVWKLQINKENRVITPEETYDFGEQHGLFIEMTSRGKEACPASRRLMLEVLDTLFYRKGGDFSRSMLAYEINDPERLKEYTRLITMTREAGNIYNDAVVDQQKRMKVADEVGQELILNEFISTKDGYLDLLASLHVAINRKLDRDPNKTPAPTEYDIPCGFRIVDPSGYPLTI